MTTSELVAHAYLALLGDIHLSHLQNAGGELVAYSYGELLTLQLCIEELVLTDIVHDEFLDESVLMLIISPSVRLYAIVLKVLEIGGGELTALGDYLRTTVVLHAH